MIIIFAAFRNEVRDIIRKVRPAGVAGKSFSAKDNIYHGHILIGDKKQEVMICITGMGLNNAVKAVENLTGTVLENAVFLILGISGSTNEKIKTGDIVIYNKIVNLDFLTGSRKIDSRNFSDKSAEKFKIKPGSISESFINLNYFKKNKNYEIFIETGGCVPFLISTRKEKMDIGSNFDVSAVDMESYYIAKRAEAVKIPFAVIRAVSDDVYTEIPDYFQNFENMKLIDKLILVIKIIFSVRRLCQVIKLSKGIKKAINNLNDFIISEIIPFINKKYFYNP